MAVNGTDLIQTHDLIKSDNLKVIITPAIYGALTVVGEAVLRK